MTTNFPGSLDSFTNPSATDAMDSVTVPHASQHANLNDAMEAVQAKLGIGAGTIGTWTSFTPSWTNLTVGNATHAWWYAQINDLFIVTGKTTLGSTSSMGTNPYFPTPTGAIWQSNNHGTAEFGDAGTAARQGVMFAFSSVNIAFGVYAVSGTIINRANVTATYPFTWTTNDTIGGTLVGYAI